MSTNIITRAKFIVLITLIISAFFFFALSIASADDTVVHTDSVVSTAIDSTVVATDTSTLDPIVIDPIVIDSSVTDSTISTPPADTTTAIETTPTQTAAVISTPLVTPILSTDKADYAPTEKVTIFGNFFGAVKNIFLKIVGGFSDGSSDEQVTHTSDTIITDEAGDFTYEYQLDGIYRPDYTVEAFDSLLGTLLTSTTFTDSYTDPVPPPVAVANPSLGQTCGIDIALLADISTSIDDTEMGQMKTALSSFANAFTGTPTIFSLSKFGTIGSVLNNFERTPAQMVTDITALPNRSGTQYTNWDDGLAMANGTFASGRADKPNLLIIATDGDPNKYGNPASSGTDEAGSLAAAITRANTIKTSGTRILVVGIGVGGALSTSNLVAISGPNVDTGVTSDVITSNFATLSTDLAVLVENLCGGTLIVNKVLPNDNGGTATSTQFSYSVNGGTAVAFESDGSNSIPVSAGTYTVVETNPMTGYTLSYSNCSNVVIPNGGTATCTITNDDIAPSLTLNKIVTNDNGGGASESAWTLTATGATTIFGPGATSSTDVVSGPTFSAGTYTLSESAGPTGYSASAWTCTSGVTVNGSNQITLGLGQSTVCSITNDDNAPSLTLVKTVTNNNGGGAVPANWTLTAAGYSSSLSQVGTYNLSESGGPTGYTQTSLTCSNSGTGNVTSVTLGLGENVTCTFVNDDQQGSLQIVKRVVNDNGGTATHFAFGLTSSAGALTFSAGTADGTDTLKYSSQVISVNAGSYTLLENDIAGYTEGTWSCTGATATGTAFGAGSVTVANGGTVVCTVTNDDIAASLIVIKNLFNDNGGTLGAGAFTMNVTGTNVSTPSFPGAATPGTTVTLSAGSYSVAETPVAGYVTTYSADCSATAVIGVTKTCTITNDDIIANVITQASSASFTLVGSPVTLNGSGSATSAPYTPLTAGIYTFRAEYSGDANYLPAIDTNANTLETFTVVPVTEDSCRGGHGGSHGSHNKYGGHAGHAGGGHDGHGGHAGHGNHDTGYGASHGASASTSAGAGYGYGAGKCGGHDGHTGGGYDGHGGHAGHGDHDAGKSGKRHSHR